MASFSNKFVNESSGTQNSLNKEIPSFIKPAPTGTTQGQAKKNAIALDSLEPVIVSGVSSAATGASSGALINTTGSPPNPNNPSPQNFASSAKGMDLLQGGDILQPRGDPQFVGLTKLTYQAG